MAPETVAQPVKFKEPVLSAKPSTDKTEKVASPVQETKAAAVQEKGSVAEFAIDKEVFDKLSDLDKLVFEKLRDEYSKIAKLPSDGKESSPRPRKDAGYLINLINAYIHMSTATVSTDDTLLRSQEKDGESESKEGSTKERKFKLFNQQYRVALAPQSSLYKGIQARRARSVNKNLAKAVINGVQSDKSYSHTSK